MAAWSDPGIAAVLTARGGYGSAALLPFLSVEAIGGRRSRSWVQRHHRAAGVPHHPVRRGRLHGPCVAHGLDAARRVRRADLRAALTSGEALGRCPRRASRPSRPGATRSVPARGNLTQLAASMARPGPSTAAGLRAVLEDVNERPYRLDRMITQLRFAGVLDRARAIVFGEMPGCDEPDGSVGARDAAGDALRGFGGPICGGCRRPHRGPALTLPLGVRARVAASPAPILEILESAVTDLPESESESRIPNPEVGPTRETSPPHRHVRHGDGHARRDAEAHGAAVRGSDQNVYPPMSTFLEAEASRS